VSRSASSSSSLGQLTTLPVRGTSATFTDAEAAITFYEHAFGWQIEDLGFAMMMIRRPGYGDHVA
jgi:predicted enzyme related to lactoylglutathione lyase